MRKQEIFIAGSAALLIGLMLIYKRKAAIAKAANASEIPKLAYTGWEGSHIPGQPIGITTYGTPIMGKCRIGTPVYIDGKLKCKILM